MSERLQKFMADAGVCSRRAAERMILEGRVTVNGEIVTRMGVTVDPGADAVKVDGKRIHPRKAPHIYLVLNKPRGVVTTMSDPEGRPTVADLIPKGMPRLFPAGRLDFNSEGLLLLTDDGELARNLTHPSRKITKVYQVKLKGRPDPGEIRRLEQGIFIEGRRTAPAEIRFLKPGPNPWYEIRVTEGRKHLVRKLFESVRHPVIKLKRTGFGPLVLRDLPVGQTRSLLASEIEELRSRRRRKPRPARTRRKPA
ncbi:MAG: rRNA pseudouridine synthase [Acidobacteria bacterium]|uniref:Pseudouridine synthase n=1 Tax=Candidatus Polarisedimenticola svalbardensis TaxID=2886004 RepID=A0A8J7CBV5_9BACT|nr:rRNA pseudouridine synthase [Candidatus Polarisedimenticola svalbardensis]